ncbi:CopL family metal-binding regulatory protein [Xylella taiwanensis]|nr:CopL family metal-binding regulatory protein [Xylella taiwanensis]QKD99442.1 CopL family metal-binding regulatory protein [Xylella taiwanensis]
MEAHPYDPYQSLPISYKRHDMLGKTCCMVTSSGVNIGLASPYTDQTSRVRRVPLSSLLLRLLISLCLMAHACVSAWASVGMIQTVARPSMHVAVVNQSCHDVGVSGVRSAAHVGHGRPTPPTPCGKIGHCDCLQHSAALLLPILMLPVSLGRRAVPLAGVPTGQGLPVPYCPLRPPIA